MTNERPSSEEAILDAAERVFSAFGYEGASMRKIAESADVTQALLHYHFETKERLYAAVFERRSTQINQERSKRLAELVASTPPPTIEQILHCYYAPVMLGSGVGRLGFAQMVASTAMGNDERSNALIEKFYDPIAREFIDAMIASEPRLSRNVAVWAYLFALGARAYVSAPSNRASRLSDGGCDSADGRVTLSLLVTFVAGGIRSLIGGTPAES